MNLHRHARLTPRGRALLVQRVIEHGLRVEEAAQASGISARTAYKWLKRFREEGAAGLQARSSRPHHCPHATPTAKVAELVGRRRQRHTYRQIAHELRVAPSTTARLLKRACLNRLSELEPARPANRFEYPQPGDLLHLDIKKLGRFGSPGHRVTGDRARRHRGIGWDFMHLAIDDHSRVAFGTIEPGNSACRSLLQALRYYRSLGVHFQRVMTDNGPCYLSKAFQRLLRRLGLRHIRTRPYTPRTNGKAERLVQTILREWAYACAYDSSRQRTQAFPRWLHHYNWHRPHAAAGYRPPIIRLPLNNVVGLHI